MNEIVKVNSSIDDISCRVRSYASDKEVDKANSPIRTKRISDEDGANFIARCANSIQPIIYSSLHFLFVDVALNFPPGKGKRN